MKLWENNINVVLLSKVVESWTLDDASPNSLIDSITSPKMKTMEGKGVEVRSLVRNTSGGEGRARVLGWGLGRVTNMSIIQMDLYKPNKKLVNE